LLKHI
jgi:hypothetical protein